MPGCWKSEIQYHTRECFAGPMEARIFAKHTIGNGNSHKLRQNNIAETTHRTLSGMHSKHIEYASKQPTLLAAYAVSPQLLTGSLGLG